MRKRDSDKGLDWLAQVFPETSTNSSDHLALGRLLRGRWAERRGRQGVPTGRGFGRGVPDNWLAYVQYLVEDQAIDQARAAVEAARKALPADRRR